jgi:hypothetical protein
VVVKRRARGARRAGLLLALIAACTAPAAGVLDVVEVPAAWGWREISGLAFGPDGQTLYAVSDRGRLSRLAVRIGHDADGTRRLRLQTPPQRIALAAGLRPNAEALAWRAAGTAAPAGGLLIADEQTHQALLVDVQGRRLGTLALPGTPPPGNNGGGSGVEAMAWHPVHGLMAALQRPPRGADKQVHLLHSGDGRTWGFEAGAARASLKALEVTAEGVWVLEKLDQGKTHRTLLRRLSAEACAPQQLCESARLELTDPRLRADDNLEALACRGDGRCVLASDDGGAAGGRTVLMLVQLPR